MIKKKKVPKVKTFPVPYTLEKIKEDISISTTTSTNKYQIINKAFKLHSQGNIAEAAKYYKYFIEQGFKDHRVFSNYGIILRALGHLQEAELSTRKAIELNPNFADAYLNLGSILKELGNLKDAELSTRKAIELNPNFADAYLNLGSILKELGNLKDAELSTRKAIELNPNFTDAHLNLGVILQDLGNLKDAELSTRKAIELNPNFTDAHLNLGVILQDLGNLKDAELSTRKAIELNPNFADAHSNLGSILKDLDKLKDAELSARKAIELNPNLADAHLNLGDILRDIDNLRDAELSTQKAIELNPNFTDAHLNLGVILQDLGNLKDAELATRKAIKLNPDYADAYFNLSSIQLLKGNYQSGLKNYEYRFKKKKPVIPYGKMKIKRSNTIDSAQGNKLLIVAEQGLGDTLQFMRYIPYIFKQGIDVSFCAQEKLHTLIKTSGIDKNPLTPEKTSQVAKGVWIPLLSVPKYLKVSPKNPIVSEPYIDSTFELKKKWKQILSNEKKPIIGINWQGNPELENTYKGRSIPLKLFSTLLDQNDITLLSLQKSFGSEQFNLCSFKDKFVECQTQIDATWDFLENAAIIENCDLIITCDTSIAHLAGGMGKNVWLLLRDVPYWTWGLIEESTFWYPSMRLFRQKERHNWEEVMRRVSNQLKSHDFQKNI